MFLQARSVIGTARDGLHPTEKVPLKRFVALALLVLVLAAAAYGLIVVKWSYSTGERAGWVQKFSRKGWVCKTWEGELAMVAMPGATPEKFYFTVWDDAVAARINQAMGERVSLHYEQKVGLPGSCFGETDYWVNDVKVVGEPQVPGMAPAPSPAPSSAPAPSN
ncbi:MAG TPA: hypothetical protein VMU33_03885 [Burkholderiaceae bacterium]|nr:hypothetical protein [Burkholderiaceae bacterium]